MTEQQQQEQPTPTEKTPVEELREAGWVPCSVVGDEADVRWFWRTLYRRGYLRAKRINLW